MDVQPPIENTPPVTQKRRRAKRIPDGPLPVPPTVTVSTSPTTTTTSTAATTIAPHKPRISVLEKRLAGGNPFGVESVSIPLKEPGWVAYIANGGRSDARLYEMRAVKGWDPIQVSEVAVPVEHIGFRASPEGYLCRGEKGHEVVFKMRVEDWQRLLRAKTDRNLQTIGSSQKTKVALATAAGTQFGDEAGQFVHDHFVGEVRDWRAPEDLP